MSRPSFQFYHGDWRSNAKLRRCTRAERGDWIDTMCLFADSDHFGVLLWPLKDLAQAVGCPVSSLKALREKGVLKGADKGERCQAFVFIPRHGGKDGEPVVLLPEQDGPIWYSSRMVRDEYIRSIRGEGTRFGAEPKKHEKPKPKVPIGENSDTGSSSSTPSSTSLKEKNKEGSLALPDWLPLDAWSAWLEVRPKVKAPNTTRALQIALNELTSLRAQGQDPRAVLEQATMKGWRGLFVVKNGNGASAPGKQTALEQHNLSVAAAWTPPEVADAHR